MGDGADMALDRGFNDEEEFYDLQSRGSTQQEYFEAGFMSEDGVMDYPKGYAVARISIGNDFVKPSGPGPCPRCGVETVERLNRKLSIKFYGCPRFPECKGNRDA